MKFKLINDDTAPWKFHFREDISPSMQYDESKITVVRLDENKQLTDNIQYTDTLAEAGSLLKELKHDLEDEHFYHVHIGSQSSEVPDLTSYALVSEDDSWDGIYQLNLFSIDVPEGVTSIPEWFCNDCQVLKQANLPSGITSIGSHAFYGCYQLTHIHIPESVTAIGDYAFGSCRCLESITLPSALATIGEGAFTITHLLSIVIPSSVTRIGTDAFTWCDNLTSIVINKPENSISGAPWGATNATVTWDGV